MRHSIETKILQNVLNYLATRPYQEVAELVLSVQKDAYLLEGESGSTATVESIVSSEQAAS